MGNFNRGDRFGGGKRFDNDRGSRRGERSERPTMHHAVCSECGRDCEVPFRPTGDKPVYCSECFGNKESSGGSRFERRSSDRGSFQDKKMFKAICDKCGKSCEVPFKPTTDKPVYCSDCFGKGERGGGKSSTVSAEQFEMLSKKLDDIIKLLSPKSSIKKIVKDEKPVQKTVEKVIEKKSAVKKSVSPKKEVKKTVSSKKETKKPVVKKKAEKKKSAKKK